MIGWRTAGIFLLTGLFLVFLQTAVFPAVLPQTLGVPNTMVILVVMLAFYETSVVGAGLAFLLGLELDLFSGGTLVGPWAGAMVAVYGLLASLSQHLFIEAAFAAFFSVLGSTVVASLVFLFLTTQFQATQSWFIGRMLVEGLITALLAPLLIRLFRRIFRRSELAGRRRSSMRSHGY